MLPSNQSPTDRKVFVGGLPPYSSEQSLLAYFLQFGEIEEVNIVMDKHTNRSKGYGFVLFKEPLSALTAVSNPYPFIDGKSCNCNLASIGAKPQSNPNASAKRGMKRSGPSDSMSSKRSKSDDRSRPSYVMQLQNEKNIFIDRNSVINSILTLKTQVPPPDVYKYFLEMMEVFVDDMDEQQRLYNELLENARAYWKEIDQDKANQNGKKEKEETRDVQKQESENVNSEQKTQEEYPSGEEGLKSEEENMEAQESKDEGEIREEEDMEAQESEDEGEIREDQKEEAQQEEAQQEEAQQEAQQEVQQDEKPSEAQQYEEPNEVKEGEMEKSGNEDVTLQDETLSHNEQVPTELTNSE